MSVRDFLAELKRRNVYKVAVAYAIVAWLLIQVATQVFPFLEIPNWAIRLVIMLLALGFPVALILAWAFELTPEGIKRAEDVSQAEAFSSRKRGKWMIAVVVVPTVALALLIMQLVKNRSRSASVEIPSNNAVPEKSIAVLPFANLSRDPLFHSKSNQKHLALFAHADEFRFSSATTLAKSLLALSRVKMLRLIERQLAVYRKRIEMLFAQHPDHELFASLPGAGPKLAPRPLSELGEDRERFQDAESVQCYAGTAPESFQSGQISRVSRFVVLAIFTFARPSTFGLI